MGSSCALAQLPGRGDEWKNPLGFCGCYPELKHARAVLSFLEFDRFASGAGDQGIPDAPVLFAWQLAD